MFAFAPIRGGYFAHATVDEKQMLAGLARDIIYILGSDVEYEIERRQLATSDVFAALENQMGKISVESAEEKRITPEDPEFFAGDDALTRLLPDMSEDPEDALELRKLTEESIASAKIFNLTTLYIELNRSNTEEEKIFVANEDAKVWLIALNDMRLVLASRLGINDAEMGESVYARSELFTSSYPEVPDDLPEIETPEDMMTVLYSMISWWQESLLSALRNKALRG